ncbi:glycosyltransferase family 2 protein [Luteipulveratus flavus]|uniref:Glycosyltransferase n=1 Tax=Luteipulveratus flavus TaxID=3031728 RepID=A0ABT6CCH2_9MICO|nr:glycosyltransferase family 2 protein [Luteipulveratus sp. YIM 133296]MDF8266485.1 glycosyltransferase [Luteipulveratus sp. YIM 133296]
MAPLLSVGIPVYNGEKYLAEALDSIRAQTLTDIEILIADNGSTDGTEQICRAAAAADPRVRYLRSETNLGGPRNLNRLVEESTAPLFKWAFYDDRCAPTFLEACVRTLEAHPDAVLAHPRVLTIDEASQLTGGRDDADLQLDLEPAHRRLAQLYVRIAEQALFGVIRTDSLRRTRGIQPLLSDGFILLTELCLQGPFVGVPEQLLYLRDHGEQHGGNRASEMRWLGSRRRARVFGYTQVTGHLLAAVRRCDLDAAEKARCAATVGRHWTLRTWRSSASDVKHLYADVTGRY